MIDSHAHIYAEEFKSDLSEIIKNAQDIGVSRVLLPNIEAATISGLNKLVNTYPTFFYKMMGLHPCSVSDNYKEELEIIKKELDLDDSIAVGEIGVDLYWDKSTQGIQEDAFLQQCQWAKDKDLPIVIHSRESIDLIIDLINHNFRHQVRGVFHCFTGTVAQAQSIIDLDMYMGIGGVITFKNSDLRDVVKSIPLNRLLIETDSPYLAPMPYRGKRNEPAYVIRVVQELSQSYGTAEDEIITQIDNNTLGLFKI